MVKITKDMINIFTQKNSRMLPRYDIIGISLSGTIDFGKKVECGTPRNGNFIKKSYVKTVLNITDNVMLVPNFEYKIFNLIQAELGGTIVHSSDWVANYILNMTRNIYIKKDRKNNKMTLVHEIMCLPKDEYLLLPDYYEFRIKISIEKLESLVINYNMSNVKDISIEDMCIYHEYICYIDNNRDSTLYTKSKCNDNLITLSEPFDKINALTFGTWNNKVAQIISKYDMSDTYRYNISYQFENNVKASYIFLFFTSSDDNIWIKVDISRLYVQINGFDYMDCNVYYDNDKLLNDYFNIENKNNIYFYPLIGMDPDIYRNIDIMNIRVIFESKHDLINKNMHMYIYGENEHQLCIIYN